MSTDRATGLWQLDETWDLQLPGEPYTVDRRLRAPTITLTRPGVTICINVYTTGKPPGPMRDAIVHDIEHEHPDGITALVDTHTGLRLGDSLETDTTVRFVYRGDDGPFAMVLHAWSFVDGKFIQMSFYLDSLADMEDALVAAASPTERTHAAATG